MGTSILIAGFVFGVFILVVLFLLQLDFVTGTIFALAAAGLYILFQYLLGPTIVAASTRLNYIKPGENPWLESAVKELADKDGLPMPRIAVAPNSSPNAFTFGRSSSSATLAVHEGLLTNLNQDEIKGVIAHELGHIKHKDYIVMTVLSALPLIAYIIAQFSMRAGMFTTFGNIVFRFELQISNYGNRQFQVSRRRCVLDGKPRVENVLS